MALESGKFIGGLLFELCVAIGISCFIWGCVLVLCCLVLGAGRMRGRVLARMAGWLGAVLWVSLARSSSREWFMQFSWGVWYLSQLSFSTIGSLLRWAYCPSLVPVQWRLNSAFRAGRYYTVAKCNPWKCLWNWCHMLVICCAQLVGMVCCRSLEKCAGPQRLTNSALGALGPKFEARETAGLRRAGPHADAGPTGGGGHAGRLAGGGRWC